MSFELHNDTLVRGFVAHIHSIARRRALLITAAAEHPENLDRLKQIQMGHRDLIIGKWESIRADLFKVLGVQLKPWHELALPGSPESFIPFAGRDELQITMRELKKRCDKARHRDPSIMLMKSWDLTTHERKTTDE